MASIPPNYSHPPPQDFEHSQSGHILVAPQSNTTNTQYRPQNFNQPGAYAGTAVSSNEPYNQRLASFTPQPFTSHHQNGPRILSNGQIYSNGQVYNPPDPNINAAESHPQRNTFEQSSQPPSTSYESPQGHSSHNANQGIRINQQPPQRQSFKHANQSLPLASNQAPVPITDPVPPRLQADRSDDDDKDKQEGHSWHDMLKNTAEILDDVKDIAEAFGGHGGHGHGHGPGHGTSHGHSHGSGKR